MPDGAKLFEMAGDGSQTPKLTSDKVIRILRHYGFLRVGRSKNHQKWQHPLTGEQVIVVRYRRRVLPRATMRAIIEGSGIAPSEWSK